MQANNANDNELQKAINNITNGDGGAAESAEPSTLGDGPVGGINLSPIGADAAPASETPEMPAPEAETSEPAAPEVETPEVVAAPVSAVEMGNSGDLGELRTKALSELRPLVEQVEMPPEGKFRIYKEILTATNDQAALAPAYEAAKNIPVEKDKAEALLFVVETIDKLQPKE